MDEIARWTCLSCALFFLVLLSLAFLVGTGKLAGRSVVGIGLGKGGLDIYLLGVDMWELLWPRALFQDLGYG